VAELVESQEESFEAADIQQADEPQQVEQTQEPVVQEAPPQEEDLPAKYKGKDLKEIIRMHQEAEKLIGRQAQEVGEVRKLADELIKRQLDTKKEEAPATKEDEIDFFDDPKKAVRKEVESHPAIREAKEQALAMKQMQTVNRLNQEFPGYEAVVADPDFAEWVKSSQVRLRLFAQAHQDFDYDAAAELLGTWKYIKPKPVEQQTASPVAAEVKQAQKAAVKAATVDVGSGPTSPTSSKVYRRADLIRLQLEDPDRYMQLQDEIMAAYSEGRVK
jgi:hypothetical protein